MPTIKGSPSIGPLKDAYQEELLRFLDSRESPKAIYWQRAAIAPVNLIVGHSVLKEHGVCHSFMIDTQDFCPPPPTVKTVFFVLHSDLKVVDIVRNFLKQEFSTKTSPSSRDYCIIAIPSFSLVCRTFLKEMQVYDKLAAIYELPLTLLPIDSDLLSMEDPECFADFALRDKETCLFNLARGLIKFQAVFGLFPRIRAKGPKAKRVASMLVQMRHEATVSASLDVSECATSHLLESPGQAHLLILIDRSVDLLTPCLSQLTYHGLLAEVWPVKYGSLKLPTSDASGQKSQRIVLNSSDSLFGEICDQNFASVGPILSKRTKELSTILNETKASKELATLKRLVGQLPELRQLHASASQHMDLAETLQDYAGSDEFLADFRTQQDFLAGFETDRAHPLIEQRILQLAPIEEVLRLICIQSFCNGGLKQRLLDFYRHEILQSYGFEHMLTLDNLERLGLLGECSRIASLLQTSSTAFQSSDLLDRDRTSDVRRTVAAVSSVYASSLRRSLRLQVAPDPPNAPTSLDGSLSHLLGGTVPISVRLVQAMALGWPSRALNTLTAATVTGGTPIGGALSAASSMANNAIQAGRRLVSGGTVGSPVVATTSSSSGGYVTSLLHTVEVDEVQVPGEFSKSSGGEGVTATKMGAGVGGRDVTRTVVVAFVGGITHSEVAALRKIAAADEGRVDFIIVTTGFLSWKSFIQSLSEPINVAELTS
uniref:Vacuolar protein sorting-associated protein 33A n=1 Tax=Schistocephalus solidus TaxID=70667 RepID=A0A0X3PYU4_SCHSO